MEATINIDEAGLISGVGRLIGSLVPDQPGAFQDSLGEALNLMMEWEQGRFLVESSGGGDWPDLSIARKMERARDLEKISGIRFFEVTSGFRGKRGSGTLRSERELWANVQFPILYETSNLFQSLLQGGTFNELIFTADSATQQTVVGYAAQHQLGIGVPQRQFVVMPDEACLAEAGSIIRGGIMAQISSFDFTGGAAFEPAPF
jgi:hypothetical protein